MMSSTMIEIGTAQRKPQPVDCGNLTLDVLKNLFFYVDPVTSTFCKIDPKLSALQTLAFSKRFCVERKEGSDCWYHLSWTNSEGKERCLPQGDLFPMAFYSTFNAWKEKLDHLIQKMESHKLTIRERVRKEKFVEFQDKPVIVMFQQNEKGFFFANDYAGRSHTPIRIIPFAKSSVVAHDLYFVRKAEREQIGTKQTLLVETGWNLSEYDRQMVRHVETISAHFRTCVCSEFKEPKYDTDLFDLIRLIDIPPDQYVPGISNK